jgi:DNA-binding NtrC family response regulator
VDDERDYLETLLKRMQKRALEAAGVRSGEEALAFLAAHEVDVVVLDVRMPGMDGLRALREIKKIRPLVEVIMLTGHACLEVAREGMAGGAFDYLMKPVDFDELLYKLEDAGQKKALQEEKIKRLDAALVSCRLEDTPRSDDP